jgi:hypothetical protein
MSFPPVSASMFHATSTKSVFGVQAALDDAKPVLDQVEAVRVRTLEELADALTEIYQSVLLSDLNSILICSESKKDSCIVITIGKKSGITYPDAAGPDAAWPCFTELKAANKRFVLLAGGSADFQEANYSAPYRCSRDIAVHFFEVESRLPEIGLFGLNTIRATVIAAQEARLQTMAP